MKKRYTILIVDDELPARKGLRRLLEKDVSLDILPDCRDGVSAVTAIQQSKPDIVFLDIQMPGMDGFETIKQLVANNLPIIIFVTAYDHYAVEAFDIHALDYVLKPVLEDRLTLALNRAKEQLTLSSKSETQLNIIEILERVKNIRNEDSLKTGIGGRTIAIKSNNKTSFINIDDIDWIEAEGDYMKLHIGDKMHLLHETMNNLENTLDPLSFMRIHRSTIVNIHRILELRPLFAGDYIVILKDGITLTLSRTHHSKLKQLLGKIS